MVTVSPRLGRVGETERAPCTGSVRIGGYRVGPEEAGRLTVTVQAAEASPALAVMVAVPGPTAVTRPAWSTTATVWSLEVQVTRGSVASAGRTEA